MQDTLIFSLNPRWIREILDGRKTQELRRRPPKLERSVPAILYETAPACRIRAMCMMGPTISLPVDVMWKAYGDASRVEKKFYDEYFKGVKIAHALEIRDVTDLGFQFTLAELRKIGFRPPQSWCRASTEILRTIRG